MRKIFSFFQNILVFIVGLIPLFLFTTVYAISIKEEAQEFQAHIVWGNSVVIMWFGMMIVYGLSFVEFVIAVVLAASEEENRMIFGFILFADLLLAFFLGRFFVIPEIDYLFSW